MGNTLEMLIIHQDSILEEFYESSSDDDSGKPGGNNLSRFTNTIVDKDPHSSDSDQLEKWLEFANAW